MVDVRASNWWLCSIYCCDVTKEKDEKEAKMMNQAVILCGGRGERLNDGVRFSPAIETPKPLMEVGGKPFVTYAINTFKGLGIADIVLLLKYRSECYEFLKDDKVRLVETQDNIDKAVLGISGLQEEFLLLNGDCYPIVTDWQPLLSAPCIAVKINGRDAGIAAVLKKDVENGFVSCSSILAMLGSYPNKTILGGLHIGTYQGLQRARMFMDLVCFGQ